MHENYAAQRLADNALLEQAVKARGFTNAGGHWTAEGPDWAGETTLVLKGKDDVTDVLFGNDVRILVVGSKSLREYGIFRLSWKQFLSLSANTLRGEVQGLLMDENLQGLFNGRRDAEERGWTDTHTGGNVYVLEADGCEIDGKATRIYAVSGVEGGEPLSAGEDVLLGLRFEDECEDIVYFSVNYETFLAQDATRWAESLDDAAASVLDVDNVEIGDRLLEKTIDRLKAEGWSYEYPGFFNGPSIRIPGSEVDFSVVLDTPEREGHDGDVRLGKDVWLTPFFSDGTQPDVQQFVLPWEALVECTAAAWTNVLAACYRHTFAQIAKEVTRG